jgi:hypothetical protein
MINIAKSLTFTSKCAHIWEEHEDGNTKERVCKKCSLKQHYNDYYGKWKNTLL